MRPLWNAVTGHVASARCFPRRPPSSAKGGKRQVRNITGRGAGGLGGALIRRNVVSTWDSGVSRSTGTPRGKILWKT
jgi:hypothetical protein